MQFGYEHFSVGFRHQAGTNCTQFSLRLEFRRERSRRVQECDGFTGKDPDCRYDPVVINSDQGIPSTGVNFLIPDLQIVGLLDQDVHLLPRKTGLSLGERRRSRVAESHSCLGLCNLRSRPDCIVEVESSEQAVQP
jgi:hypothetical protein